MTRKRAAVSDGSTHVNRLERRFHHFLHNLVFTSRVGSSVSGTTDTTERICIVGWDDATVRWLARVLHSGPYHTDQDCIDTVVINSDATTASFTDAKYVILCLEMESVDKASLTILTQLFEAIRFTHSPQVRICCVLVGDEDDYKSMLHRIYANFPEMRWLVHRHQVTMINLNVQINDARIDGYMREGLRNWLVHKSQAVTKDEADEVLDYSDIFKIIHRESRRHLPELMTVVRLLTMCVVGCVWVLFTVIALVAITGEAGLQKDLQTATDALAGRIARQRTGKAEWGWRTNAAALTALQLYHSSWCFASLENQRSVDRMEIGLLAAISRSREKISREITLVQLASHVMALLATYQNPRDFYGHDLVTSLEDYVIHQVPYISQNHYAHSLAVLALYNVGVQIERKHVERLLVKQKVNGNYMYGPDECAIVAMALTTGSQNPEIELGMRRAVNYLVSQRRSDGSYGSVAATALTVQALNATNTHLGLREEEKTIKWLVAHLEWEPSLRSLDVAAHVLTAISGKTLLDIRYFSARLPEKNAVALRNPLPVFLKVDDEDEDDTGQETEDSRVPEIKDDSEILLEDHADTRTRANTSRHLVADDIQDGGGVQKEGDGDGQDGAKTKGGAEIKDDAKMKDGGKAKATTGTESTVKGDVIEGSMAG